MKARTTKVVKARRIYDDPPQWAGETDDGRPVYARAKGGILEVRVGRYGTKKDDVPSAVVGSTCVYQPYPEVGGCYVRNQEIRFDGTEAPRDGGHSARSIEAQSKVSRWFERGLTYKPPVTYDQIRQWSWPEVEWPERAENEAYMVPRDDFFALDEAVAQAVVEFIGDKEVTNTLRHQAEKEGEDVVSDWLRENAMRQKGNMFKIELCDSEGTPCADVYVANFSVSVSPDLDWVKIVWGL